jgi:hypothetical protein
MVPTSGIVRMEASVHADCHGAAGTPGTTENAFVAVVVGVPLLIAWLPQPKY